MPNHHPFLVRRGFVLILAGAVVLGACGGGSDSDTTSDTSTTSTVSSETTTTTAAPSGTSGPSGPSGPIVFKRLAPGKEEGEEDIYTVNPDGSGVRLLFRGPAEGPLWSPDGTEVFVFCCDDGMAAHFVNVARGELRSLPQPDPAALEAFCGGAWSPDGERLTCETFGGEDPSLNGIYSIRASDGSDLTRITSNPGGNDIPGDYSPDGSQIVFSRFVEDGASLGMFVVNVDGSGLRQITPTDMNLDEDGFAGEWSPDGNSILVVARTAADRKAIWVVSAAGGDPVPLPIDPECGGSATEPGTYGCYSPSWSPDGTKIVFVRSDGSGESIYMVNADGSGLVQVTDGEDDQPHWGPL